LDKPVAGKLGFTIAADTGCNRHRAFTKMPAHDFGDDCDFA
jgi:hypothetical protein